MVASNDAAKKFLDDKLEEEARKKKKVQLQARLLKIKLAATGMGRDFPATEEARRGLIQDTKSPSATLGNNTQTNSRVRQEMSFIKNKKPIYPKRGDAKISPDIKSQLAQEHGHSIVFKGIPIGVYRTASLVEGSGHYAKYWLLNAKETNGNGWGISAKTAKQNMGKFVGRPLVVTASSWHGASDYGNKYEHPYLPTNDMNQIFAHQEKYRVGNIVEVQGDSNGDYYATIEMLPKFANMMLPPFCSPAIYQLDASEHEGNISKWEALHLAALDENPAYGARIALLKGTCVGTGSQCAVQFKVAKQETMMACPIKVAAVKDRLSQLKKNQKIAGDDFDDFIPVGQSTPKQKKRNKKHYETQGRKIEIERQVRKVKYNRRTNKGENMENFDTPRPNEKEKMVETKSRITKNLPTDKVYYTPLGGYIGGDYSKPAQLKRKLAKLTGDNLKTQKSLDEKFFKSKPTARKYEDPDVVKIHKRMSETTYRNDRKKLKMAKLKLRLAALGSVSEFQHNDIEGALRKIHASPLPTNDRAQQSSFLSSDGDFIGGGEDHTETIKSIFRDKTFTPEDKGNDGPVTRFSIEHHLPRVQRRITKRGGRVTFGIHSKLNNTQIKSILDLEKGNEEVAFVVGPDVNGTKGEGGRDLVKALREHNFI